MWGASKVNLSRLFVVTKVNIQIITFHSQEWCDQLFQDPTCFKKVIAIDICRSSNRLFDAVIVDKSTSYSCMFSCCEEGNSEGNNEKSVSLRFVNQDGELEILNKASVVKPPKGYVQEIAAFNSTGSLAAIGMEGVYLV